MQTLAQLYGNEDGDRLIVYRAEIRAFYEIIGEFDGEWQGDQYMFRVTLDERGKFMRAIGEVTAELLAFFEEAVRKFIEVNGDRTVLYCDEGATVERVGCGEVWCA